MTLKSYLWSTRFLEIHTGIPWSLFSNVKMRIFTWIKLAVQSFNVWLATCIPVQLATLFKEYGKHGILTGNVLKFKPLLDHKGQKNVDYERMLIMTYKKVTWLCLNASLLFHADLKFSITTISMVLKCCHACQLRLHGIAKRIFTNKKMFFNSKCTFERTCIHHKRCIDPMVWNLVLCNKKGLF